MNRTVGPLPLVVVASLLLACEESEGGRTSADGSVDAGSEPVECDQLTYPDCEGPFICYRGASTADDVGLIERERVCDGVADCSRAQDETNCPELENLLCDSNDDGGRLVYRPDQMCDEHAECFRADDERDCPDSLLCPRNHIGGGHFAIPRSKVCDGVWDCLIDELDCPNVTDAFICPNGKSIDRKFMCDQASDCTLQSDGGGSGPADEVDPSCHQYSCKRPNTEGQGRSPCQGCKPFFVPESKVCDGVRDCQEGDDEQSCPAPFACSGGLFVRASARCDGKADCPQADDEQSCP